MATYREIQIWIRDRHGFAVKNCWIAHAKQLCGIPVARARNRQDPNARVCPCPADKLAVIKEAFEHFGMMPTL